MVQYDLQKIIIPRNVYNVRKQNSTQFKNIFTITHNNDNFFLLWILLNWKYGCVGSQYYYTRNELCKKRGVFIDDF